MKLLKDIRKATMQTQVQLGKKLGYTAMTLSALETCRTVPSFKCKIKLYNYLKTLPDEIIDQLISTNAGYFGREAARYIVENSDDPARYLLDKMFCVHE